MDLLVAQSATADAAYSHTESDIVAVTLGGGVTIGDRADEEVVSILPAVHGMGPTQGLLGADDDVTVCVFP